MDIDLKEGTITFRVVYAGPRGATKFLNLRGLQSGPDAEALAVLHAGADRILTFEVPLPTQSPVLGLRARFEAVAAPGDVSSPALERLLLLAADAVVFLPDRSDPSSAESLEALTQLVNDLEKVGREPKDIPLLVQDYVDGQPRLEPRSLDPSVLELQPKFLPARGDTPETTRSIFGAAIEAILERVASIAEELGEDEARDLLLLRLSAREQRLDAISATSERDPWWKALIAVAIGAALAGAFLAWVV